MAWVVLATIGSLGDLHPFIAIGRALVAQGHRPVLAVPEDGVAKARGAGLEAVAVLPSYQSICARLGMAPEAVAARVVEDVGFVMDAVLMPSLADSTRALDAAAAGADVIAGSLFALATGIVAEKRRLPLAAVVLQPMTLFSACEPPAAPRFEMFRHRPLTAIGRGWNRAGYALLRAMLRGRHGRAIDAVRREHGLGPAGGAPLLDTGAARTLCCWSAALGPLPRDAPAGAVLTGFPFFDSETGGDDALAPELASFLDAGEPPLVFTLGSFAVAAAGDFYPAAARASRRLGRRALLLTGQPGPPRREGDCLLVGYAPHSAVFARAAAVIHHGGAGTTGQALRGGRVQVVVPHFGDQFDNAARLGRAGVAVTIRREAFNEAVGAAAITRALAMQAAADAAARVVAGEDGAATAARLIASLSR